MGQNIYVGNISFTTTEDELRDLFSEFGEVLEVHVVKDRETDRARGFAFVEMATDDAAQQAISSLDGKEFGGRTLKVNAARPKTATSRGRPEQRSYRERRPSGGNFGY